MEALRTDTTNAVRTAASSTYPRPGIRSETASKGAIR
jgi:hypothetical protein